MNVEHKDRQPHVSILTLDYLPLEATIRFILVLCVRTAVESDATLYC